ncbi:hypothetical protein [Salipiger mucosus]|uniref:Uncharacterized protein n=1 Tax=Salipiger mucosus DSM 16094 TaxID=1123237 RepID=S9QRJ0_9RHOB|nr:hypothetical protein [Salipiger mucosus]EPX82257.1 hypothetical protein Salmuc_03044 [Salipiger mucosus DSM 16094]
MDRFALFLMLLSATGIAGTLIIVFMSLGIYNAWWFVGAGVVGLVMAWPSAWVVSRYVKNQDPSWEPRHKPGDYGLIPPRDAPEV